MVLLRDDPLDCGDDVENNFNNNNILKKNK